MQFEIPGSLLSEEQFIRKQKKKKPKNIRARRQIAFKPNSLVL